MINYLEMLCHQKPEKKATENWKLGIFGSFILFAISHFYRLGRGREKEETVNVISINASDFLMSLELLKGSLNSMLYIMLEVFIKNFIKAFFMVDSPTQ